MTTNAQVIQQAVVLGAHNKALDEVALICQLGRQLLPHVVKLAHLKSNTGRGERRTPPLAQGSQRGKGEEKQSGRNAP